MHTKIIKINPQSPGIEGIRQAAGILKAGGLLAFPTETVYGLGANATSPTAAARIYAAKGRPSDNPLIVHIADFGDIENITDQDLTRARMLAESFWPGPLTLVLKKASIIPMATTGGLETVAVRLPGHEIARRIIKESGIPIAAPSANISGKPSPTRAKHVIDDLDGIVDGIVDAGDSVIGLESTIVDLSVDRPVILRRGYITAEEIERVLGTEVPEPDGSESSDRPRAPGMKYKHYAPAAELSVVTGDSKAVAEYINDKAELKMRESRKVGILCSDETRDLYQGDYVFSLGSRSREEDIMQSLYAGLRRLDSEGIEVAFCEDFSELSHGSLIMERLKKASGGRIINL